MLSGRVESYTQNLAGQITARLANNKAARNPVIVPIGLTKNSAAKGLVDQISPLDYDNGLLWFAKSLRPASRGFVSA